MTQSQDSIKAESGFAVRWYHALAGGLVHAALMLLAFPPISLFGISIFAALPLLFVAWHTAKPFRHGFLVAAGMLPFYAYHCDYIYRITSAGYVPLLIYLSAWPGLFVWMTGAVRRRMPKLPAVVLLPVIWTGFDTLRGEIVWGGFEWYQVGQPLISIQVISSIASIGGGYLLTLIIVLTGSLLFDIRSAERVRQLAGVAGFSLTLIVLGVSYFFGGSSQAGSDTPVKLSLVQTNVPQDNKVGWTHEQRVSDYQDFTDLTLQAATGEPDLIIWPETMFPGHALDEAGALAIERDGFGHANGFRSSLLTFQSELKIPMLIGAVTAEGLRIDQNGRQTQDATYNSAYTIVDGKVQSDRYDKLSPTPFGETLPYIKNIPWLERLVLKIGFGASGMSFGLDAGKNALPLELQTEAGPIRIATPICFESTQSRICRSIVVGKNNADLMVVMTNDGWFGSSDHVRKMHLLLARWRCKELGVPMARAANTGQSCFIDAQGRVVEKLPPRESGVLTAVVMIDPSRRLTWYSSLGNVVGWLSLAGLVSLLGGSLYLRFNERPIGDTKRDS
jgi:apolipoprotein N-acyltransferase